MLLGGLGYIGSHAAVALSEAGHEIIIYDNLVNSSEKVIDKLKKIIGRDIPFIKGDIKNTDFLEATLSKYRTDAVLHFAGLKSVEDSIKNPIEYYDNNVLGTISLLKAMANQNIKKLIFSSSATVYGHPNYLPIDESHPLAPTNPYGKTKLYIEGLLEDLVKARPDWKIVSLRYFNPVGSHSSGILRESPKGVPSNLMPYLMLVAQGKLPYLKIFGGDYKTPDGTGVRDYIHIMDLAEGHLAALNYLSNSSGYEVFNLGTGTGFSVVEVVAEFQRASQVNVPHQTVDRRSGDVASCYAAIELAKNKLNWKSKRNLYDMCHSSWVAALEDDKKNK